MQNENDWSDGLLDEHNQTILEPEEYEKLNEVADKLNATPEDKQKLIKFYEDARFKETLLQLIVNDQICIAKFENGEPYYHATNNPETEDFGLDFGPFSRN